MPRLKADTYTAVAQAIRPFITPMIEARGQVTDREVADLVKRHTGRNLRSEFALESIQQALCEA